MRIPPAQSVIDAPARVVPRPYRAAHVLAAAYVGGLVGALVAIVGRNVLVVDVLETLSPGVLAAHVAQALLTLLAAPLYGLLMPLGAPLNPWSYAVLAGTAVGVGVAVAGHARLSWSRELVAGLYFPGFGFFVRRRYESFVKVVFAISAMWFVVGLHGGASWRHTPNPWFVAAASAVTIALWVWAALAAARSARSGGGAARAPAAYEGDFREDRSEEEFERLRSLSHRARNYWQRRTEGGLRGRARRAGRRRSGGLIR